MSDLSILNLSPNFAPVKGLILNRKSFVFSTGFEPQVMIENTGNYSAPRIKNTRLCITTRILNGNDLLTLFVATDAAKRMGFRDIEAVIPFIPCARQDRIMQDGEGFSLKVVADLINLQGYSAVTMYDPHSDVAPALINNSCVISNETHVKSVLDPYGVTTTFCSIVVPDAGAYKKIAKLCNALEYDEKNLIICNKNRSVLDGSLAIKVPNDDYGGRTFFIIDDIVDGGATFQKIASELKRMGAHKVNLIVSHCILSKGIHAMPDIDHVYTTDSLNPTKRDNLSIWNLKLYQKD